MSSDKTPSTPTSSPARTDRTSKQFEPDDDLQAVVAAVAAEHGLAVVCVPAGTRNHFAFDLGIDRNDLVGSLDAFVGGDDRRVDLGHVNGRVFVDNVAMGVHARSPVTEVGSTEVSSGCAWHVGSQPPYSYDIPKNCGG